MKTTFPTVTLLDFSNVAVSLGAILLVQSTLLITAGLVAAYLCRKKGAALQSLILRATLAAVLVCPLVSYVLGEAGVEGPSFRLPKAASHEAVPLLSEERFAPREEAMADSPSSSSLSPNASRQSGAQGAKENGGRGLGAPALGDAQATPHRTGGWGFSAWLESLKSLSGLSILYCVLTLGWLAGALALLFPLLHCHARIGRLRWQADMAEVEVFERCQSIARELKVAPPEVLAHREVQSPLLVGLLRPAILLPALPDGIHAEYTASELGSAGAPPALPGASPGRLSFDAGRPSQELSVTVPSSIRSAGAPTGTRAARVLPILGVASREVLVHELAHLARGDCLWHLIGRIATALVFFQPLLWVLVRRIEETAEEVCDNYVIEHAPDRRAYARQLVDLAERLQFPRAEAVVGVGVIAFKSGLGQRIVRILDDSRVPSVRTGARPIWATALFGVLATSFAAFIGIGAESSAVATTRNAAPRGGERLVSKVAKPEATSGPESTALPQNTTEPPAPSEQDRTAPKTREAFGMTLRRVAPAKILGASWPIRVSPDGKWLAYGNNSRGTLLYEIASGTLRELPPKAWGGFSFSADSSRVAMITGGEELEVLRKGLAAIEWVQRRCKKSRYCERNSLAISILCMV